MPVRDELPELADAVLQPGFVGTTAPDWVRRRLAEGLGGVALFARNVDGDTWASTAHGLPGVLGKAGYRFVQTLSRMQVNKIPDVNAG